MRRLFICTILSLVAAVFVGSRAASAQVTASVDTYVIASDSALSVEAPGVLENDVSADSLGARLVSGPAFGQAQLRSDGSFEYTPPAGFNGRDSLIYVAQVLGPTVFEVDSAATLLMLEADLSSSFGSDSDDAQSSVGGSVTAYLLPSGPPFFEVHVTDLELVLLDSLHLEFKTAFATLTADVKHGGMSLHMLESGGPVPTSGTAFYQPENALRMETTATLRSPIQSGDQEIVIDDDAPLTGFIRFNAAGDSLLLELPIDFSGTFEVSGADVDVTLTGTLLGAAPYVPAAESDETVVRFEVGTVGTAIADAELPASVKLHPVYPNPFNPQAVVSYELQTASNVRLTLLDATGRELSVLESAMRPAGRHELMLDAAGMAGGVYFVRLETDRALRVQKAVILK